MRSYISSKAVGVLQLKTIGDEQLSHSLFGGTTTAVENHGLYQITVENLDRINKEKFQVFEKKVIRGNKVHG